jgi:hypothetical protein
MQWNALDLVGPCSSSHRRFQEWERAGVFHEIWREGLLDYDDEVGIDWSWLAADGAMTKAPLGGPKTGPNPTSGRSGQLCIRHADDPSERQRGRAHADGRGPTTNPAGRVEGICARA